MTVARHISSSDLAALDQGEYRTAIARYREDSSTADPVEIVWRAEIALYLDRMDDVRAELDRLLRLTTSALVLRARIIRAEAAFWDLALDEAAATIEPVIRASWEAGEELAYIRASLLQARIALGRRDTSEALDLLRTPQRYATVIGNDLYAGIAAQCRAHAHFERGEYKQAGHAFAEALHLLGRTEAVRWEAACRLKYALFLADVGRYEDSLLECDRAERIAIDLGISGDALRARTYAARTLLQLDRYDEVVERLRDTVAWERQRRHQEVELHSLQLLSTAHCEMGQFEEARRMAEELEQSAEVACNWAGTLDGRVLRAWAMAQAGIQGALDDLLTLLGVCDVSGTELQRAEARLYTADVVASDKPDVAHRLCREARALAATDRSDRLRRLTDRIEQGLTEGPLHIGPHGELIVDVRDGWPDFDSAVETLKRFLVAEAVRASDGNRAEAARRLGLTRSRLHDLWHHLTPPPPSALRKL